MSELLRTLILEDSENDAILLQRELQHGGYELDTLVVDNADAFEAALTKQEWDIVISDYAMGSFDATAALKILQEKQLDIPFVIVSGTVGEDVAVAAMKAGADDFFSKDKLTRLVPAVAREVADAKERYQRRRAEAQFQQSEARFATVFHASPVGIAISRIADGKVLDVNERFLEIYGYSREDFLKRTRADLWVNHDQRDKFINQLKTDRSVRDLEAEFRHASGSIRHALISAEIIKIDDEPCILSMVHDITERKLAQEQIKRSNDLIILLRDVAFAANEAHNAESILQFVIERVCAYTKWDIGHAYIIPGTGYDNTSIQPTQIWHLADAERFKQFREVTEGSYDPAHKGAIREVIHTKMPLWMDDVSTNADFARAEVAAACGLHGGYIFPIIANQRVAGVFEFYSKHFPDDAAREMYVITTHIGTQVGRVIERFWSEAILLESEERYRALFENSGNPVYVHDLGGNFIDANDAALKLLGYQQPDVASLNFASLLLPEELDRAMRALQKTIELGYQPNPVEFGLRRKDGSVVEVEIRSSVLYKNNIEPYAVQGIAHDITERKRTLAEANSRRQFTEALHITVSYLFSGDLEIDQMLKRILENTAALIPNDSAALLKVENGVARPAHSVGLDGRDIEKMMSVALVVDETRNLREMAQTRSPVMISDIRNYDGWRTDVMPELISIRASLGAPIFVGDHLFGFITLDSRLPNHFRQEQADRLAILTDQAAVAIHNAQLYQQVQDSEQFARNTVNALSAHIAILDETGQILSVNQAWLNFAQRNTPSSTAYSFEGENYLAICDATTGDDSEYAAKTAAGIRAVISGQKHFFLLEYPCHAPDEPYWFNVRVTRFRGDGPLRVVVAHENITAQKLAEIDLERYIKRLEILHEIDQAILRADDPPSIAEAVLEKLTNLLKYYIATITLYDLKTNTVNVLAATSTVPAQFGAGTQHKIQNMAALSALEQNRIYLIYDLLDASTKTQQEQAFEVAGIRSYARIPMIYGDKLLGSINFHDTKPNAFSRESFDVAREIAAQLAIALENARLLEIEFRRTTELTAIHQASLQLTSTFDLQIVLDTILDYVILLVQADNAHIFLYENDTLMFGAAQWDGQKQSAPIAEPRQHGVTYTVARTGERMVLSDIREHPAFAEDDWEGAFIGLPLRFRDEVKGVMNLVFAEAKSDRLDEHEIRVIELLADQAAIAIHNAQLYEQIQRHADDLEKRVNERTRQLQQSKDRVEAILNITSDFVILANWEGKIYQTNPVFDGQFGYPPDVLFQHSLATVVAEAHAQQMIATINEVVRDRTSKRIEVVAQRRDKSTFPADALISAFSDGDDVGVVCSLRDITLQKQVESELREALEREKELNELKTKFTSMVSHEFRTPLAVILSTTGLLTRHFDKLDPERRQTKLEGIGHQVHRLTRLMDDILLVSRSETVGFEFNPKPVDLVKLCENIIDEVQVGQQNDVTIEFTHEGDYLGAVIDEFLFTHILQNLTSNAVKYSRNGGYVHVKLQCAHDSITLQVEDQGIGIPQKHQKSLFESFQRASNVAHIQGTGIGLTIVKRAVDTHGGEIDFKSVENEGTTFTVRLPVGERL